MLTRYSMPIRWMPFQRLSFHRLSQCTMTHNLLMKPWVFPLPNRLMLVREVPHPLSTVPAHQVRRPLPLPVWQIVYDDDLMLSTTRSALGLRNASSDQHIWTVKRHMLRSWVVQ